MFNLKPEIAAYSWNKSANREQLTIPFGRENNGEIINICSDTRIGAKSAQTLQKEIHGDRKEERGKRAALANAARDLETLESGTSEHNMTPITSIKYFDEV